MEKWMILSIASPAFLVWLFVRVTGMLLWYRYIVPAVDPLKNPALPAALGNHVENHFISSQVIREKILDPENYQRLLPQMEAHVDHFLRVRLKTEMPIVGSLIGDRTIAQMKGIFLKELEALFPEVMEGYVQNFISGFDIQQKVTSQLREAGPGIINNNLKPVFDKAFLRVQLAGLAVGIVIGLLEVGLFLLINR